LHPGDTFVDVGSHIGLYSLLASAAVGAAGRVVAVDADPQTFARLGQNLRLNNVTNVQTYNYAVSNERGSLPLYRWSGTTANAGANTLIPTSNASDKWLRSCDVPCVTLSDLLSLAGVKSVTGLKIDIERAEYRVLSRFIADAPVSLLPSFILFEEYESTIELAGGSAARLLESSGRYCRLTDIKTLKRNHIFERIPA